MELLSKTSYFRFHDGKKKKKPAKAFIGKYFRRFLL